MVPSHVGAAAFTRHITPPPPIPIPQPSPCRDIANTQHASTSTCMLTRPPPLSPLAHLPAPGAVGAHDTTADNMTTPEMQCSNQLCTIEQDGTHTRPVERPLFPLFRPREQVKVCVVYRHPSYIPPPQHHYQNHHHHHITTTSLSSP